MKKDRSAKVVFLSAVTIFLLSSCSFMEMSGTMTRKTGETMEDYSKKNEGFIATMAGFGGRINTAVGCAVEDAAREAQSEESEETKTEQFVEVNKKVMTAAWGAASGVPIKETVIEAQKRLYDLGFDPGPADGIVGKKTAAAIAKYQEINELEVTKSLDKYTLESMGIK